MTRRRGVTLIELIVVLVVLGIATALSSVAMRAVPSPQAPDRQRQLMSLRSEAIRRGAPLARVIRDSASSLVATALADGRLLVDSTKAEDPHAAQ